MELKVGFLVATWLTVGVYGVLRVPKYYSNHMVLQRAPARAILWGYADVIGDTVTVLKNGVQIEEGTVKKSDSNGTVGIWKVKLPAESHAGPYEIQVKSSEGTLTFADVMFGDVWMCSGQSNMQFKMAETPLPHRQNVIPYLQELQLSLVQEWRNIPQAFTRNNVLSMMKRCLQVIGTRDGHIKVYDSAHEIDDSIQYRNIRMIFSDFVKSSVPLDDVTIKHPWIYPVKGIINNFSALCFMFARDLQKHVNYPIGVIESNWGGTPIEVWSSPDAINACPTTVKPNPSKYWPTDRGALWNSMIHPYLPMTMKGAIWYQGESNAGHPDLYACQFPAMIDDWRKKFHAASDGETSGHFPFGFVQLAPYRAGDTIGGFPQTRWAQTTDLGYVPNSNMPDTFMAVAIDLPDFKSPSGAIHPTYKQDVAARLVLGARNVAYGERNVDFQGPFPTAYGVENGQHSVTITFNNGTGSLHKNNNNGFEVCCATTTSGCSNPASWVAAPIKATTTSNVEVDASGCHGNYHIAGVRYLWKESPCALKQCALYDSNTQLPVPPFVKIEIFKSSASVVVG